ncbi:hypothetical protein D7Y05_05040 [bacterium 1XD42-54]|jgi:hypothetical protein|nr:hypothetical protein D7Y05_05040 [bacterium 1XD42-54]
MEQHNREFGVRRLLRRRVRIPDYGCLSGTQRMSLQRSYRAKIHEYGKETVFPRPSEETGLSAWETAQSL